MVKKIPFARTSISVRKYWHTSTAISIIPYHSLGLHYRPFEWFLVQQVLMSLAYGSPSIFPRIVSRIFTIIKVIMPLQCFPMPCPSRHVRKLAKRPSPSTQFQHIVRVSNGKIVRWVLGILHFPFNFRRHSSTVNPYHEFLMLANRDSPDLRLMAITQLFYAILNYGMHVQFREE